MFPILMQTIQRDSAICFPMLGNLTINPPSYFTVFGKNIYFYGVIIGLGFILGMLYCARRSREFGLKPDDVYDLMIWLIPFSIIGARLYYVLFELENYLRHPAEIFAIREGGLAIYGGIIGASLALILYCGLSKKRRAQMLPSFDIIGLGLLIGQAIGRWGNFFNREAHGGVTDSFLRMGIIENGQLIYVHPTFLYESLWNLIGLALIHFLSKKRKFDGQVFLYYIIWYGLGRAWIEGLRTDSLYWGPFRVSQVLAAVSCLLAVGVLLYVLLVKRPDPANMLVNRAAASAGEPAPEETSEE